MPNAAARSVVPSASAPSVAIGSNALRCRCCTGPSAAATRRRGVMRSSGSTRMRLLAELNHGVAAQALDEQLFLTLHSLVHQPALDLGADLVVRRDGRRARLAL